MLNNKEISKNPLASAIGCVLAMSTVIAHGQEVDDQSDKANKEEDNKIIVVGSRIRKDGYDNQEPIEIITAEDAKLQGFDTLGELLRSSTIASGSPQVTSATSTAFVQNGGTGTNTLSLRGLGANRTLVLLNGRRAGPAGTRGGVSSFDLNVIPLSAVDRVEILKDGASSLYGSDAVAGVVNIITKTDEGGGIDVFASQPEKSGGEQYRLSATWGTGFENGNIMVTADYTRENELAKGDRKSFKCSSRYIFEPHSGQRVDPIDPRTGQPQCNDLLWGHVWLYDYQGPGGNVPGAGAHLAQFDYDGDLGNYIPGYAVDPTNPGFLVTPPGWFPVAYDRQSDAVANADHPFQDQTSLIPKNEKTTIYLQGDYEFNDSAKLYTEVLLNRRKTSTNGYRQFWSYKYNENFFAGDSLSQGWRGAQWLSPTAITDEGSDQVITVDYSRFVAGLTGDIGNEGWYYDLSFQASHSSGDYQNDFIYNDAIVDQNFASGSCVGQTNSVTGRACQDVPWLDPQFLAGNISPEMKAYLFGTQIGNTKYDQRSVEGVVSGDLFELSGGPIGVAIGFHYRTDKIKDTPGEQTLLNNTWGSSSAGITAGDNTTKAVFGEADIPLVTDVPGIQSLDLSLSARYTDVSSFGNDTTYKVGLNWAIDDEIRIRASQGTSFRSPALFELFLADQTSFANQRSIDPCINWGSNLDSGTITQIIADNCAADGIAPTFTGAAISATVITGGGNGVLKAETSVSKSLGIVWTPEDTDLAVSLDYFDFTIKGEVTQLGAATIVGRCYSSEFFSTDPLCQQFDRDPLDQRVTNVRDSFLNIASQRNRGYDLSINFNTDTDFGKLIFESRSTFQVEDSTALFEDTNRDFNGEFGDPKFVSTLRTTLKRDDWNYTWTINYFGAVSNINRDGGDLIRYRGETVRAINSDSGKYYHAFSVNHEFDGGLNAVLGVANVFDERPPQVTTIGTSVTTQGDSAFYSQYDWRGRRAFLNVQYKF